MAHPLESLQNFSPPNAEELARMTATLTHHIRRLEEKEGAGNDNPALNAMIETWQRIRQRQHALTPLPDADPRSLNSSFSDTFSESFLCSAEAAADDNVVSDGAAAAAVIKATLPMTPAGRHLPLLRREKRKTEGLQWTPLHGIRRKAALADTPRDVEGNSPQMALEFEEEEAEERTPVKMNSLDSSFDLFE